MGKRAKLHLPFPIAPRRSPSLPVAPHCSPSLPVVPCRPHRSPSLALPPEPSPPRRPPSVEKLFSTRPVPGAKTVGERCLKGLLLLCI